MELLTNPSWYAGEQLQRAVRTTVRAVRLVVAGVVNIPVGQSNAGVHSLQLCGGGLGGSDGINR